MRVIQSVYSLTVSPWYEVTVGIDSDLNTAVSELFFYIGKKFPVLDE